ncbi:MAG: double-cubane-cluster-containing anaerobic reductase [Thermoplasmatota archaeon]
MNTTTTNNKEGTVEAEKAQLPPFDPNTIILEKKMRSLTEYLRVRNGALASMGYFYEMAEGLYSTRKEELSAFKGKGGKVVGIMCNFVPEELILAAGAVPVRLAFGYSDTILAAEEYLPRNFCPLLKSSFGTFLKNNPLFTLCDVVIIPTSCDGKKKMGELISPFKQVWVLEVPHCTNTTQGRDLWLREVKLLSKRLTKLTGRWITRPRLSKAITVVNRKRAMVRRLYETRKKDPSIWGRDALLVTSISYFDDVQRWTLKTEELCAEVESRQPLVSADVPRIMITGSPLVAPTWKVPIIIEESGGIVVTDDLCTGTKGYWDPVERNFFASDQFISIADRYLMNTCACFTPNTPREVRLKHFVEDWRIDGVVYHVSQACHTYGMEQRRINQEMERLSVPVLNIETDFSQEDVEQIRTRIEAFLELIVAKKRRSRQSDGKDARSLPGGGIKGFLPAGGFPIHEQPAGKRFEGRDGQKLDSKKLEPPGG